VEEAEEEEEKECIRQYTIQSILAKLKREAIFAAGVCQLTCQLEKIGQLREGSESNFGEEELSIHCKKCFRCLSPEAGEPSQTMSTLEHAETNLKSCDTITHPPCSPYQEKRSQKGVKQSESRACAAW
jgi:hypothetical protein